jgi:DNA-binding transcriptional ArsR family regulator
MPRRRPVPQRKARRPPKPAFIDPVLTKALAHPTRVHCLSVLNERVASPRELADERDEAVQNVAYHIRVLKDLGCIELVRTEKGRSTEHFYRALKRHFFDAEGWSQVAPKKQSAVTATLMQLIGQDINEAMASATLDDPSDNHISRTPLVLDPEGWSEVVELLESTLMEMLAIQTRTSERTVGDESKETIRAKVEIIHFRSPDPK